MMSGGEYQREGIFLGRHVQKRVRAYAFEKLVRARKDEILS